MTQWVLILVAVMATLGVAIWWELPRLATMSLLCNLVGTALLATALEVQGVSRLDSQTWLEWFFDRTYAHPVGFNKAEFYLGLIVLAVGAIFGAIGGH